MRVLGPPMVFVLLLNSGLARGDIVVTAVAEIVSGQAYVNGYNNSNTNQTYNQAGNWTATVPGNSGQGNNYAQYLGTFQTSLLPTVSIFNTQASFVFSYDTSTATVNAVSAGAFQTVLFTSQAPQQYTLSGSVSEGQVTLYDSANDVVYDLENFAQSSQTISYTGILPAGDYKLHVSSADGRTNVGPGDFVETGSLNVTLSTSVPEPSSFLLAGLATLAASFFAWRRGGRHENATQH
jgi:PEP-CTERM motif